VTTDSAASPDRRLRVLLLVAARDEGGAERAAEDLIRSLSGQCDFTVVLPDVADMGAFAARLSAHARVELLPLERPSVIWRALLRVRQLARQADVVHLNSNHPASRLAILLSLAVGRAAPLVSVEHSGTPPSAVSLPPLFAPWAAPVFRFSRRRAAAMVAVSEENARRLTGEYGIAPSRVATVHNGVRLQEFDVPAVKVQERRRALGIADRERVVLVPARQAPNKGHRFLVPAAGEVVRRVPNVRFVLAGAGERDPAVRRAIVHHGLEAAFLDAGFLAHDDLAELMAGSDVLALPSLAEGFSLVLLEGMAAGAVLVASTVGGARELITHGVDGFLVPPGDTQALGHALVRALELTGVDRTEMTRRARARVEGFTIDATAAKMLGIYRRARPS
jgi:glycosyltransferase involved in cell wall biosynthesis